MEEKKETIDNSLSETKNQITTLDQKATVLLITFSMIFVLIVYLCNIFGRDSFTSAEQIVRNIYIALFLSFCVSTAFSLISFVLVILPIKKLTESKKNIFLLIGIFALVPFILFATAMLMLIVLIFK